MSMQGRFVCGDQSGVRLGRIHIRQDRFIHFNAANLVQMRLYDPARPCIPVERHQLGEERTVE